MSKFSHLIANLKSFSRNPADFIRMVAKELKMYAIGDISKLEDAAFASVNLYARTKLGMIFFLKTHFSYLIIR